MKKVLLIGTGGTITAQSINKVWKPGVLSEEKLLKSAGLKDVDVEIKNLFRIDSSDMQPGFWIKIAKTIYEKIKTNKYDGIVITHGTDTMCYTGIALSFLLQNIPIPIILTGSQLPAEVSGSDATKNLSDAIKVAANVDLFEVAIVFNSKILRVNRTRKIEEKGFDPFSSIGFDNLGFIVDDIKLSDKCLKRHNQELKIYTKLEEKLCLIKLYPGFDPKIIFELIDNRYKGFVIEGFGAANIPINYNSLLPCIVRANEKNIPIIITSQCANGYDWTHLYENGKKALDLGAISGYDMLSETILVKLMWVLAQTNNLNEIKKLMKKNIAGEISDRI